MGITKFNLLKEILKHPKVKLEKIVNNSNEILTTKILKDFCDNSEECNILYFHTKGVTKTRYLGEKVDSWTSMMEYFLIEKWEDTIKYLDDYMTVGCQLINKKFGYHYSGNFWWSKSSYIKKLIDPNILSSNGKDRYLAGEFWILNKVNKSNLKYHKEIFHVNKLMYKHFIKKEIYQYDKNI